MNNFLVTWKSAKVLRILILIKGKLSSFVIQGIHILKNSFKLSIPNLDIYTFKSVRQQPDLLKALTPFANPLA